MRFHRIFALLCYCGLFLCLSCNNYDLLDKLENPGGDTETKPCTTCRIFLTAIASYTGNLGGVAGADSKCQSDASRPNDSTYKALIADNAISRQACINPNCTSASENTAWVLHPNTQYVRTDGTTKIFFTNAAGIHDFATSMDNSIALSGVAYTGLKTDWTSDTDNCNGWLDGSISSYGAGGDSTSNNSTALKTASEPCNTPKGLYCVEQ